MGPVIDMVLLICGSVDYLQTCGAILYIFFSEACGI